MKTEFVPHIIFKDHYLDRVFSFSLNDWFELVDGVTAWRKVDSDLHEVLHGYTSDRPQRIAPYKVCLMRDGVLVLGGTIRAKPYCAISYPDRGRANKDRTLLLMYLGRRAVDAVLFRAHIAPFLFPY